MLQQIFPKIYVQYSTSPHGELLDDFAGWLIGAGYVRRAACGHVRRLKQVLERAVLEPFTAGVVVSAESLVEPFVSTRQPANFHGTRRTFERFLTSRGQLVAEAKARPFSCVLDRYRQHLSEGRGLAIATVDQHVATVERFLTLTLPEEEALQDLSAPTVESFVVNEGRRVKRQTLQHIVARLRSFLRFCHDRGDVRRRLDLIDTPRVYRGELPPRAPEWRLVQRLLRSIDRNGRAGWRDYTALHLMAHYGLRPSEIVALTVGSIDWEARTLRVIQRKTRSDLLLPLADRTLGILKSYLERGRSGSDRPELFLRVKTPAGPITRIAIRCLYDKRVAESGLALQETSCSGLRHAFAMRLLDRGVGLKAIGDLLGHRSFESTCVYLRLHTRTLREVGLPLPSSAVDRVEDSA